MSRLLCLLLLAPLVAAACSSATAPHGGGVRVAAAVYPLAWAAQRVGGDRVAVTDLTPPGVEPHDLELDPAGAEAIARADLLVYEGGAFQPAVAAAARGTSGRTLDVTPGSGKNLHPWLDPVAMSALVGRVAAGLAAVDPARASDYARRARHTEDELDRLSRSYSRSLRNCRRRAIFTSHAAFGGLAAGYDLTQVPLALDPEAEPPAGHLAAVIQRARTEDATVVFAERGADRRLADVVAAEVGAETATLDPLERPPPTGGYVTSMRHNLHALQGALGCR